MSDKLKWNSHSARGKKKNIIHSASLSLERAGMFLNADPFK